MNKNISQDNLPNVKLNVDTITNSITVSRFSQASRTLYGDVGDGPIDIPKNGKSKNITFGGSGGNYWLQAYFTNTEENKQFSLSPKTSALGSGRAFDITPSYYTVHMWLRIS